MNQASEQQFQDWEQLIRKGVPFHLAAKQAGTTMRRLRNGDPVRAEQDVQLSREIQAATVEERVEKWVLEDDASPAIRQAYMKANHPDYADKQRVEISGPDGGPIGVEGRVTGLADVVAFAIRSGNADVLGLSLDAGLLGKALPPAEDVLPDARDSEPAAGALPPARPA